jgi:hypothetical protein
MNSPDTVAFDAFASGGDSPEVSGVSDTSKHERPKMTAKMRALYDIISKSTSAFSVEEVLLASTIDCTQTTALRRATLERDTQ